MRRKSPYLNSINWIRFQFEIHSRWGNSGMKHNCSLSVCSASISAEIALGSQQIRLAPFLLAPSHCSVFECWATYFDFDLMDSICSIILIWCAFVCDVEASEPIYYHIIGTMYCYSSISALDNTVAIVLNPRKQSSSFHSDKKHEYLLSTISNISSVSLLFAVSQVSSFQFCMSMFGWSLLP